jgi:hypothetical protein
MRTLIAFLPILVLAYCSADDFADSEVKGKRQRRKERPHGKSQHTKSEHQEMLDWHCSRQPSDKVSALCEIHLNKGHPPGDLPAIKHGEVQDARKEWCSISTHNSSLYCISFFKGGLTADIDVIKASIKWWCSGAGGGTVGRHADDTCDEFLELMLKEEQEFRKVHDEIKPSEYPGDDAKVDKHKSMGKVKKKFQKRLAQLYWKKMKVRGDAPFHHLLEGWCEKTKRDASAVCARWEKFRHDHISEL